jgi:putative addiction module component (TIGR02574 family)
MKMKNMLQPKRLLADALKLPASSRALMAQKLLESLESQEAIDAAIVEGEHRWQAFKDGNMKAVAIEEVFPKLARKEGRAKS